MRWCTLERRANMRPTAVAVSLPSRLPVLVRVGPLGCVLVCLGVHTRNASVEWASRAPVGVHEFVFRF